MINLIIFIFTASLFSLLGLMLLGHGGTGDLKWALLRQEMWLFVLPECALTHPCLLLIEIDQMRDNVENCLVGLTHHQTSLVFIKIRLKTDFLSWIML